MANPVGTDARHKGTDFGLPQQAAKAIADLERGFFSAVDGLVAHSGGGQPGTQLTASLNRVVTVAAANDSVSLPSALAGAMINVVNASATNSMNVFPQSGEFINALAVNTAFAVAAGKSCEFFCAKNGTWHTILSA